MSPSADAQDSRDCGAKTISQAERELATLSLAAALGAAYAVCAQLAARSRLQATVEPTYQRNTTATFLHAAARFLYQARVVLDPGVDMDDWRDQTTDVIQQHTEQVLASSPPAVSIDEQAQLTAAMNVLASESTALAAQAEGPTATVLAIVQACIKAAASQLKEAELFARPADANGDQPDDSET